jgi:hypothetical protein
MQARLPTVWQRVRGQASRPSPLARCPRRSQSRLHPSRRRARARRSRPQAREKRASGRKTGEVDGHQRIAFPLVTTHFGVATEHPASGPPSFTRQRSWVRVPYRPRMLWKPQRLRWSVVGLNEKLKGFAAAAAWFGPVQPDGDDAGAAVELCDLVESACCKVRLRDGTQRVSRTLSIPIGSFRSAGRVGVRSHARLDQAVRPGQRLRHLRWPSVADSDDVACRHRHGRG